MYCGTAFEANVSEPTGNPTAPPAEFQAKQIGEEGPRWPEAELGVEADECAPAREGREDVEALNCGLEL